MPKYYYNGVEFPDINSVWTDKGKYSYATIIKALGNNYYDLILTQFKPTLKETNANYIRFSLPYADCHWKEGDDDWEIYGEYGADYALGGFQQNKNYIVWANYDVLNADGSVYLPAREPEPVSPPYLTFSSAVPFTIGVANTTKNWDGTLYYSTDTQIWSEWDGTTAIASAEHNGEHRVYMRGTGNSVITGRRTLTSKYWWVLTGSDVSCNGNIENLLDYETVAMGAHPIMGNYCYNDLFYKCTALISAPELPATTLTSGCYAGLFYNTGLISAPELPATNLASSCYSMMFRDCVSLTKAPELPATELAKSCYEQMFMGCTGLTSAPELPATEMVEYCYSYMFSNCEALTSAPKLPSTVLAKNCYSHMFYYCTALTAALKLPATTLAEDCYNSMFAYCTALTSIPELPATTLVDGCYYQMFFYCDNVKLSETQTDEYATAYRIPTSGIGELATDVTEFDALNQMFSGTGGTFTSRPELNTTYYTANEVVRCEDEPEPDVPEPVPTIPEGDFYKVVNRQWVKHTAVKSTGSEWVKQPQVGYETQGGQWSALS